jgi:hypothetical protein
MYFLALPGYQQTAKKSAGASDRLQGYLPLSLFFFSRKFYGIYGGEEEEEHFLLQGRCSLRSFT